MNRIIKDDKKPGYRRVVVETPAGVAEFTAAAAVTAASLLTCEDVYDVFAYFWDRESGQEVNIDSLAGRGLSREAVKERWEKFQRFYNIEGGGR